MFARPTGRSRRPDRSALISLLGVALAMAPATAAAADPTPPPVTPQIIVTPPAAWISTPPTNAWVTAGETGGSAPWGATAVAYQGRSVVKVELIANGVVVASDTTAPYGGRFSTIGLTTDVGLLARVTDSAGGRATTPTFFARPIVVGTPALGPGNFAWLPSVRVGSVTHLLARPVPVAGVDTVRVEYRVDGTLVGTATAPPWDVAWTAPGAAVDDLVIEARMVDRMSADATSSQAVVDVIDDSASVSIDTPTDGATIGGDVGIDVTASPAVAVGDTIHLFVDGVDGGQRAGPGTLTWDSRSVDDGDHLMQVVIERAGVAVDVVSTGTGVTVANTDEPSLSFSISQPGPIIRGDLLVTAIPANVAGDPVVGLRYEAGASVIATTFPSQPPPTSANWRTKNYSDGTYRVRVIAELASGRILRAPDLLLTTRNLRGWIKRPAEGATVSGTITLQPVVACDAVCQPDNATYLVDGAVVPGSNGYGAFWDSTTVANGSHELRIAVRLRDGRVVRLGPRTFTVSN